MWLLICVALTLALYFMAGGIAVLLAGVGISASAWVVGAVLGLTLGLAWGAIQIARFVFDVWRESRNMRRN